MARDVGSRLVDGDGREHESRDYAPDRDCSRDRRLVTTLGCCCSHS